MPCRRSTLQQSHHVRHLDGRLHRRKALVPLLCPAAFNGLLKVFGGDYAVNFLKGIGKKNVNKNRLLYPVPQVERDANPLFEQNPGY